MAPMRQLRHIVDHKQTTTCGSYGQTCDQCLGGRLMALAPTEGSWCTWTVQRDATPQGACRSQNEYADFLSSADEVAVGSDDYPAVSSAANASSSSARIFSGPVPSCDLRQSTCKHSACNRVAVRHRVDKEAVPVGILALAGVLGIAVFFLLVCVHSRNRHAKQLRAASLATESSVTLDKSSEGTEGSFSASTARTEGETEGPGVTDEEAVQVGISSEATQDSGVRKE